MAEIYDYEVAAQNNNDAAPDGFPENMQYSQVNDAAREVMAVIARYIQANGAIVTAGSGNAYTLTVTQTGSLSRGRHYLFQADRSNTGDVTLNINGGGATSVLLSDGTEVPSGLIVTDGVYFVVYDGTNLNLIGFASGAQIGTLINISPRTNGANVKDPVGDNPILGFIEDDETVSGFIQYNETTGLIIRDQRDGLNVNIIGTNDASAPSNILTADPNESLRVYFNGTEAARTISAASGGWAIDNQRTGSGFEAAAGISDLPVCVAKPGNTTRTSNVSQTDDPDLFINSIAIGDYYFEAVIIFNAAGGGINGNLALAINYTASLDAAKTLVNLEYHSVSASATESPNLQRLLGEANLVAATSTTVGVPTSGGVRAVTMKGIISPLTSGNLTIRWAQQTSSGNGTVLRGASFLRLQRC